MSKPFLSFLTLFTSLSTLLCCALPALFVALGFGAAFAGLLNTVPQLVWFSEHKTLIFGVAGLLLLTNALLLRSAATTSCPTDPEQAAVCISARRANRILFPLSVAIFCVGAFFAFILPSLE